MNLNGNIKHGRFGGDVLAATRWEKREGMRKSRVVLIQIASEWCTAIHCEGDYEWLYGKYFVTPEAAWESFTERARDLLS